MDLSVEVLIHNLRARRDTLSLAADALKNESNRFNKSIILLSLGTGFFESVKYRLGLDNDTTSLLPIAASSIIAFISGVIQIKQFPEKIASIVQAESILTLALTNCRNQKEVTPTILKEYNDSLQALEISLTPETRAKFLKKAQKNLISIMNHESEYFEVIDPVKNRKFVKGPHEAETVPQVILNALSEITMTDVVSPIIAPSVKYDVDVVKTKSTKKSKAKAEAAAEAAAKEGDNEVDGEVKPECEKDAAKLEIDIEAGIN